MEPPQTYHAASQLLLMFIALWQFSFNISNSAITALLRFFRFFFKYIGINLVYAPLTELSDKIPLSLSSFYKVINLHGIKYEKYVVCPACSSVYENSHCIKHKANGTAESKNCTHVFFPNHPQRSRRKPCSHVLLKKVRTKRSYIFRPIKTYPYRPLRLSIEQLIKRNNSFLDDCEKWRTREVPNGYLCDIHDGLMWKEF